MTNEEKTEELRKTALPNPLPDGYGVWLCSSDVDEVLIKMAEWKEQQMIDKAIEWLKDNIKDYLSCDGYSDVPGFKQYVSEDFYEDFKRAMEE